MIVIRSKRMREIIRVSVPFLVIPVLVISGAVIFDHSKHIIISMGVAFLALLVFISGFERKNTGTRRLVIAAVMTALCFAGRFIPILKPVSALTIITGLYLGGETGFLVGAMSAVISNLYFGHGPWTAFQMLAWGIIGLTAGIISEPLKSKRSLLIAYGIAAGIAYSFIMDIWTVLGYNNGFSLKLYLAALQTAVPYTVSYVLSNVLFLYLLAKPFGEKLQRIKIKYGV